MTSEMRASLVGRLKRIEEQVRGIQRMVEEQDASEDVVTQAAAASCAMDTLAALVVASDLGDCPGDLPPDGPTRERITLTARLLAKEPRGRHDRARQTTAATGTCCQC